MSKWTDADSAKLFAAVLATANVKVNAVEVSKYLKGVGVERTPRAIMHRISGMKELFKKVEANGETTPTSTTSTTPRKRKVKAEDCESDVPKTPTKKARALTQEKTKVTTIKEQESENGDGVADATASHG